MPVVDRSTTTTSFASRRGSLPQALLDAQAAQRRAHVNADGSPRLTTIGDGRSLDLGITTVSTLPRGSATQVLNALRDRPDAGNAVLAADNAALAVLRYTYGTHKPMEAWVLEQPANGKLIVNVAASPSSHVGNSDAERKKNYELYGCTNVYNVEVRFPDRTETFRFDVRGAEKKPGESAQYSSPTPATLSPDIEIDVAKYAGQTVIIRGYADHSSVGGYPERRETLLHL